MQTGSIQDSLQTIFQGNAMVAISCLNPDSESIIDRISTDLFKQGKKLIIRFNLAKGLQRAVFQKGEMSGWKKSTDLNEPARSENPFQSYLKQFIDYQDDCIFIIEDIAPYLSQGQSFNRVILSLLRTLYHEITDQNISKKLILVGETIEPHSELLRQLPLIKVDLPDEKSLERAIRLNIDSLKTPEVRTICRVAQGLSFNELFNAINCSRQENRPLDSKDIVHYVQQYKLKLLRNQGIEVIETADIPEIGGHELFKEWIKEIEVLRNPEIAKGLGLPMPKGCFLGGIPGCGKTLIAKQISKQWQLPLFSLNLPSLKGGLVGQSESNLLKALDLLNSQKGVVLIDEVDKAISTSGKHDSSGVNSGLLSILLPALEAMENFVVLTANDPSVVPQELMRDGRVSSRWFVDLPNKTERSAIARIHLTRNSRTELRKEQLTNLIDEIVSHTDKFSGSEIEQAIIRMLTKAFQQNLPKQPTIAIAREVLSQTTPLAQSSPGQHQALKEWGKNAQSTTIVENTHNQSRVTI